MTVKIGISPIAWQNDDLPDLTKDFTMEQALKESRDIGYTILACAVGGAAVIC